MLQNLEFPISYIDIILMHANALCGHVASHSKGGINTRAARVMSLGLVHCPPMQLVKVVHRLLVESLWLGRVAS